MNSTESVSIMRGTSRLPGFAGLAVRDRIALLQRRGLLGEDDAKALLAGARPACDAAAGGIDGNVIGTMSLPVGLGLDVCMNGRDYVVPLVLEEPAIATTLSAAAELIRACGGVEVKSEPVLTVRIPLVDLKDPQGARAAVLAHKADILALVNRLQPDLQPQGLTAQLHRAPESGCDILVVHVHVGTGDAREPAWPIDTLSEGIAPRLEALTGGRALAHMRSGLGNRRFMVHAKAVVSAQALVEKGRDGECIRNEIVLASDLARVDPDCAAAHNKDIMAGIDALALATDCDCRALEAAAHAHAARSDSYRALARWCTNANGDLVGELDIPIAPGAVAGGAPAHPVAAICHRLLGAQGARELAEVMGAVGLARSFSVLYAQAMNGIRPRDSAQRARSVARAAKVPASSAASVPQGLRDSGSIKIPETRELADSLRVAPAEVHERAAATRHDRPEDSAAWSVGHGKIILLGEHSVVYGRHALAAPLPFAIRALATDGADGIALSIPGWGVERRIPAHAPQQPSSDVVARLLQLVTQRLDLDGQDLQIRVDAGIPRGMGVGGSAALAVAIIRALSRLRNLQLDDEHVCALAFECEKIAHGTPSGLDNTVATYGQAVLYRRATSPQFERITLDESPPLVLGLCHHPGLTVETVARVRRAWSEQRALHEQVFDAMDTIALTGLDALRKHDWQCFGALMNMCQGQLQSLGVSSDELDDMIRIARNHGAAGAKLTGGGGGGAMIALCPDGRAPVVEALSAAGYDALEIQLQ